MGALTIAYAIALGMVGWNNARDFIALMMGVGAGLMVSGALALASFVHSTPLAPQE